MIAITPTPKTGKWGDAAAIIDFNNTKISIELLKLKNATSKNFGFFESEALLIATYPTPSIGDIAFCGAEYPGIIYDCVVAGTWHSTDIAAVDLFKNNDYFNITVNNPLESGYYTLSTAIAAISSDIKKQGLVITFAVSATEWQTWQFEGSLITYWNNAVNWTMLINTKHQIILEKTIAEALVSLNSRIASLEEFITRGLFDSIQTDKLLIVNELKIQGSPLFVFSESSPSITPDFAGQIYIKTIAPKSAYISLGTNSAADWLQISN